MSLTGVAPSDLYADTITVLTRAATRDHADGTTADFAGFLTQVLAATAANVGGPDRLVAGRSDSWEAGHLVELLRGTMGNDWADWLWFRSEPVTVSLNVAELIEDDLTHPGLMGLDEALESLGRRYESAAYADLDAWDSDIENVTARYTTEYLHYANRFTTAVCGYARQLPGLTVRVEMHADPNPNNAWWRPTAVSNPTAKSSDPLSFQIWQAAHDSTPLPNVDVWVRPATAPAAVRS